MGRDGILSDPIDLDGRRRDPGPKRVAARRGLSVEHVTPAALLRAREAGAAAAAAKAGA